MRSPGLAPALEQGISWQDILKHSASKQKGRKVPVEDWRPAPSPVKSPPGNKSPPLEDPGEEGVPRKEPPEKSFDLSRSLHGAVPELATAQLECRYFTE